MQITNDSSFWRAFEDNKVTHSVAHYLMAVDHLRGELGYARVTDVAGLLGISRGAASLALSHLKEKGLVAEDPNRFLLLSDEGTNVAKTVEHNFILLSCFFENVLGLPHEVAHADACKMEHLLCDDSSRALVRFLQVLLSDKDRLEKFLEEFNSQEDLCHYSDGPCLLCQPNGECLLPNTSKFLHCPIDQPAGDPSPTVR